MIKFTKAEWKRYSELTERAVHRIVERSTGKAKTTRDRISGEELRRFDDRVDYLVETAQLRTLRDMTSDEIAFDAYKMIMFQSVQDRRDESFGLSVTTLGSYDLRVDEHLLELQDRGEVDLCKWLYSILDEYHAGLIKPEIADCFSNYEPYVVE